MQILMNTGGIAATNCFLIADDAAGKAVLFDAPNDTTVPLLAEAAKRHWDLIGLWLTHGHFDHTADHSHVTARFPAAKVMIHALDEPKLLDPSFGGLFQIPFVIPPRKADAYVTDGQDLMIGSIRVRIIHTPGHSPGHVVYHLPEEKLVVGGDLIIMGAIGRTDFPDSNQDQMNESIRKVMSLPKETQLLPGHGELTTLEEERLSNEFVREACRL